MTSKVTKGKGSKKRNDKEQVEAYMEKLKHPLKKEFEAIRAIIKASHPNLGERVKWNAPSYYFGNEDIVTFGPQRKDPRVLLVFHHPLIVKVKSDLLTGEFKDRRLTYFGTMKEIEANKKELVMIIGEVIRGIVKSHPKD